MEMEVLEGMIGLQIVGLYLNKLIQMEIQMETVGLMQMKHLVALIHQITLRFLRTLIRMGFVTP